MMDTPYMLIRSRKRKKTISIQINARSEITVYAPHFTSQGEISRFMEEKRAWIARTLRKLTDTPCVEARRFVTGEVFYYLGLPYPLCVCHDPLERTGVTLKDDGMHLNCPDDEAMRRFYLTRWYQKKAREVILARLAQWSQRLGVAPQGAKITKARSRWGSCSPANALAFSYRLVMAPPAAIDYVIVHELMHIHEKNHSSNFWRKVVEAMPQYATHRRWLGDHQHLLDW